MEKFKPNPEEPRAKPTPESARAYSALGRKNEREILAEFTPEQHYKTNYRKE